MTPDRHNYEEYFILYVDNELSDEQRRLVEEFVQRNPDLREELEILSHFKLTPDSNLVFENKSSLFREEKLSSIHEGNYREWMLLCADDELSLNEQKRFDDFMLRHPEKKHELAWMMQAKLKPETIPFPDKELLYREPEKTGYLFIYRRQIAAAVIFILLLTAGALLFTGNQSSSNYEIVKQQDEKTPVRMGQQFVKEKNDRNLAEITPREKQEPVLINNPTAMTHKAVKDNNPKAIARAKNAVPGDDQNEAIAERKTNNLPQPLFNPNLKESVAITQVSNNGFKEIQTPSINTDPVTNISSQPSHLENASYNEAVLEEQPDGKKNKLRGIFRKVTRTLEKTAKVNSTDENDRLLIAGLAIKLK